MNRFIAAAILVFALPFQASAITVETLPILSVDVVLLDPVPAGMDIQISIGGNIPDVDVTQIGVPQSLPSVSLFISGIPDEPTTIQFQATWEFGEGVGPISIVDEFDLIPFPDSVQVLYDGFTGDAFYIGDMGQSAFIQSLTSIDTKVGGSAYLGIKYKLVAVPIPAAFWLLGSGLIGLMGLRRR